MRQERREWQIDECRNKPSDEQPEGQGRAIHPLLDAVQIRNDLIEVAVQNKVILQAVQLLDLCGTLRRYRLRRI